MTDYKAKRILSIFLFLVMALNIFGWEYDESQFEFPARIALMARANRLNPYLEVRGMFHLPERQFRYGSLTAGSYFKIAPWLKIGAFYQLQTGARHLEDWSFTAGPPDGHWWEDTRGSIEHLVSFDATPRFLLDFIPGRNWVAPFKVRYVYNISENLHNLIIRPGLTYVIMPDRDPVLNISLNYPLYFALNWGEVPLYSHGPYLTLIGHVNQWMKIEGTLAYRYARYFVEDSGSWTLNSSVFTFGLGVIFTPDFSR